jgi:predicted secreted protein
MKWTSALAIYFVIWWMCLFVTLPFGVRNAAESNEIVGEGHDAGAPLAHNIGRKAAVTTLLAAVIFALVYWVIASKVLQSISLPLMPDLKG